MNLESQNAPKIGPRQNVISLDSHRSTTEGHKMSKSLSLKIQIEQVRVLIPISLISIVLLVTLANSSLMSTQQKDQYNLAHLSSEIAADAGPTRGIACVAGEANCRENRLMGTDSIEEELVQRLAQKSLSERAVVGRKPSPLQKLTLGFLGGRYSVQLQNGKVKQVQYSGASAGSPSEIQNLSEFLEENREILPVKFSKSVKLETQLEPDGERVESFSLVDGANSPVAKVEFELDAENRLISMRILESQISIN